MSVSERAGDTLNSFWEEAGGGAFINTLPDAFGLDGQMPSSDAVLRLLDGEAALSRIWDALRGEGVGAGALCARLCGILLLCAIWRLYRGEARGVHDDFLCGISALVCALIGFEALAGAFASSASYLAEIHTAMTAALTTLCTLSAMRGAVVTASVTSVGMALFLSVMEVLCTGVCFPFLRVCTGLSLAAGAGGGSVLSELSALLRKQFLFLIGGMMTILCAVLSYQTVLSRAADSVTMRAVRFTLSGTVPIIGGAVSEAASTVAAGFSLVKRTVGVLGAALLLWQMLPPICEVILLRAALSLSAALASLLGMTREADILRDCASIGGFLLAIVIAASVLYLLMLSLCIGT